MLKYLKGRDTVDNNNVLAVGLASKMLPGAKLIFDLRIFTFFIPFFSRAVSRS